MRRALAVAAVALLVGAGCLGGGTERIRVAGSPSTLAPDAGFERVAVENRTLNATVTITLMGDVEGRESQPVRATIPVVRYRGEGSLRVAVAASPYVQVIENPTRGGDPLSTLSTPELVAFVHDVEPADLEETRRRQVSALGTRSPLVTYRGRADGGVTVHVARFRDGDDVVTVVAVHPADADPSLDGVWSGLRH